MSWREAEHTKLRAMRNDNNAENIQAVDNKKEGKVVLDWVVGCTKEMCIIKIRAQDIKFNNYLFHFSVRSNIPDSVNQMPSQFIDVTISLIGFSL